MPLTFFPTRGGTRDRLSTRRDPLFENAVEFRGLVAARTKFLDLTKFQFWLKTYDSIISKDVFFFVSKKYLTRPLEINCWSWWIARIVARSRWWNSWQNRGSHATVVRINWFIVIYDRRADAINRLRWLLYQLALVAFRPRTTAIHSAPSTIDPTFSHRICSMKFISTL